MKEAESKQNKGFKKKFQLSQIGRKQKEMLNSDLLSAYERMSYFCAGDFRIAQWCLLEPNAKIFFYIQEAESAALQHAINKAVICACSTHLPSCAALGQVFSIVLFTVAPAQGLQAFCRILDTVCPYAVGPKSLSMLIT